VMRAHGVIDRWPQRCCCRLTFAAPPP
jgi:hypothetical protein